MASVFSINAFFTKGIMGFEPNEVPTFHWAMQVGMTPTVIDGIEVRGETIETVRRQFVRPFIVPWNFINQLWGNQEL